MTLFYEQLIFYFLEEYIAIYLEGQAVFLKLKYYQLTQ